MPIPTLMSEPHNIVLGCLDQLLTAERQIVEARRRLSEILEPTSEELTLARRPRPSSFTTPHPNYKGDSPLRTDTDAELAETADMPLARNTVNEMDEVLDRSGYVPGQARLAMQSVSTYETQTTSLRGELVVPAQGPQADRMLDASVLMHSEANLRPGLDTENGTAVERRESEIFWWPGNGVRRFPVLRPLSKSRAVWTALGFVFTVYELFAVPVYVSFGVMPTQRDDVFLYYWVLVLSVYFVSDIFVSFMTGYLDEEGREVLEPRRIAISYIKGGLLADLLGGVPWEWLDDSQRASGFRCMKAFRILRFLRVLHILKLKAHLEIVENLLEASSVLTFTFGVAKVVAMLLAVTHWTACLWYHISLDTISSTIASNLENDLSLIQRYVYCLYFSWTTMTTVGYGDITPNNFQEVCFVLVLLFMSSVSFAYLMGYLTDIIGSLNSRSRTLSDRRTQLSRYLQWRDVPDELLHRIKRHLLFLWETNAGYDAYEEEIRGELPPGLKTELFFHIYGRVVMTAPWLCWMRDYPPCVKRLCNLTSSLFFETGDTIVQVGQVNESVYTLISGSVWHTRGFQLVDTGFSCSSDSDLLIPRRSPLRATEINEHVSSFISQMSRAFVNPVVGSKEGMRSPGIRRQEYSVCSEVFFLADFEMQKQDMRVASAARRLQRAWRSGERWRRRRNCTHQMRQSPDSMPSKRIPAPAYFGESCLWVPVDQWNDADSRLVYQYTLRCINRCEVVQIDRAAVLDVITSFSPWLAERFDCFQKAVLTILERTKREKSSEEPGYQMSLDALGKTMSRRTQ